MSLYVAYKKATVIKINYMRKNDLCNCCHDFNDFLIN